MTCNAGRVACVWPASLTFVAASTLPRAGAVSVCAIPNGRPKRAIRSLSPTGGRRVSNDVAERSEQIAGERKNRTTSKHEAQRDQEYRESICKHGRCYQSSASTDARFD